MAFDIWNKTLRNKRLNEEIRRDRLLHDATTRAELSNAYEAHVLAIEGKLAAVLEKAPEPPPEPVWERPAKIRPAPMSPGVQQAELEAYAAIAAEAGVCVPDMLLEQFKLFLQQNDWPVFSLTEVVKYMDKLALGESHQDKCGWEWRPLRAKDQVSLHIGTKAERQYISGYFVEGREVRSRVEVIRGSDYYSGPRKVFLQPQHFVGGTQSGRAVIGGDGGWHETAGSSPVYDRLVPAHALKKVVKIEKAFGDKVALFVSDYAPMPHIQHPDPFLMAVILNPRVKEGVGRFVIDFWDEPGFGIEQQLG